VPPAAQKLQKRHCSNRQLAVWTTAAVLSTKLSKAAAFTLLLCCMSHLQHFQGVLCLERCFANRLWQQVAVRVQRLRSTASRYSTRTSTGTATE
jgi:hypothetical protein